ncbi:MAG: tRNA (guanosine(37)-N1)-methyltransferase TrmD [Pirellulales bacterium]
MRFDVLTLFPEIVRGYLGQSLLKLAIDRGLVDVELHNLRDWARDKHQSVDDRPYGGGPGMVLKVEPVVEAVEAVRQLDAKPDHLILLTPQGRRLNQEVVEELATYQRLILVCGRYEGFDQRVIDLLQPDELSIGDYVLNGREVAAMLVMDAVIRLAPGVLGDPRSFEEDSLSDPSRMLKHAQYTRPREYRGQKVPDVLISGNHPEIAKWREAEGRQRTQRRRGGMSEEK